MYLWNRKTWARFTRNDPFWTEAENEKLQSWWVLLELWDEQMNTWSNCHLRMFPLKKPNTIYSLFPENWQMVNEVKREERDSQIILHRLPWCKMRWEGNDNSEILANIQLRLLKINEREANWPQQYA